jgi:probable rRNA maturation factor
MKRLLLINRQRQRKLDLRTLRQLGIHLLHSLLHQNDYQIAIHLVEHIEMTRLNETFLHHSGSTDVITFDYRPAPGRQSLEGEIFICIDDAIEQSSRFRCGWQQEVVRYLVHGVLHLMNFDDKTPPRRRVMKRHENRLVRAIADKFPPAKLGKSPPYHA